MYPVFKTITLGTYESGRAYYKALSRAHFLISDWAKDVLLKMEVSRQEIQVNLVKLFVGELGFTDRVPRFKIFVQAESRGLERCKTEVSPALRLAYPNQPKGEWLRIAMDPIIAESGSHGFFKVGSAHEGLWLHGNYDIDFYHTSCEITDSFIFTFGPPFYAR